MAPPVNSEQRSENILCAVLALLKELGESELELVRSELNGLLEMREHRNATALAKFISGASNSIPQIPRPANAIELRKLIYWPRESRDLTLRIIAKLEDYTLNYGSSKHQSYSKHFFEVISAVKNELSES